MPGPFVHEIDPVIIQVGNVYLWWYGLSYTLGFLSLMHWLGRARTSLGIDRYQASNLFLCLAGGVLIGGRVVEVVFYEWAYYGSNPLHVLWVWLGGMSTHGILFGGTLGLWIFVRRHSRSFLAFADEIAIPAALIMGLGRMGNFIDGQIVGSVTEVWWAVRFPDAEGFRHPVVLYDGLKNLLLIPVLLVVRSYQPPRGVLLGVFLFGYGFFRIFIDFFREYRTELFGIPPGQEFNIGMSIAGIALIVWALRNRARGAPESEQSDASSSQGGEPAVSPIQRLMIAACLLIPLVIPSDWTQDVPGRYGDRHPGMTNSHLYPKLHSPGNE